MSNNTPSGTPSSAPIMSKMEKATFLCLSLVLILTGLVVASGDTQAEAVEAVLNGTN